MFDTEFEAAYFAAAARLEPQFSAVFGPAQSDAKVQEQAFADFAEWLVGRPLCSPAP
jgi:hypothetical protein